MLERSFPNIYAFLALSSTDRARRDEYHYHYFAPCLTQVLVFLRSCELGDMQILHELKYQ
jgi:hypothetical protein